MKSKLFFTTMLLSGILYAGEPSSDNELYEYWKGFGMSEESIAKMIESEKESEKSMQQHSQFKTCLESGDEDTALEM